MPENQNNIDDQLIRDWAEMKKLQHPKYWMRMKHRLEITMQRKRKIRIARYAALFMLPILGSGLYFLLKDFHSTSPQAEQTLAKILPGDKKAVLYTSNGNSLVLSGDTLSLIEMNGTQISSQKNKGIVYSPPTANAVTEIYNTLVIPLKGEYNVTLSDGTQIWLNSSSSLEYPVLFSDSIRKVYLKGEAFFVVAEDKENRLSWRQRTTRSRCWELLLT